MLKNKILKTSCGCWLWLGYCDLEGYGNIHLSKEKKCRTHKLAYELHKGKVPNGKLVCHTCDVPSCVNPDHLFLGTHKQNTRDMLNKGRGKYGPNKPCTWNTK